MRDEFSARDALASKKLIADYLNYKKEGILNLSKMKIFVNLKHGI